MSVIVKGMKMPTRCIDCPFMVSRNNDDCIVQTEEANEKAETWEELIRNCPLVELPKNHGSLIDTDALIKKAHHEAKGMEKSYEDFGVLVEWLVDKIPTIETERKNDKKQGE